jgi:hypothetical protein
MAGSTEARRDRLAHGSFRTPRSLQVASVRFSPRQSVSKRHAELPRLIPAPRLSRRFRERAAHAHTCGTAWHSSVQQPMAHPRVGNDIEDDPLECPPPAGARGRCDVARPTVSRRHAEPRSGRALLGRIGNQPLQELGDRGFSDADRCPQMLDVLAQALWSSSTAYAWRRKCRNPSNSSQLRSANSGTMAGRTRGSGSVASASRRRCQC